jgi:hypothetical protein
MQVYTEIFFMKKTLRVSPNDHYKQRVKEAKKFLPANVRDMVYEKFPQYATVEGIQLLNNVLSGSSSDVLLTEILEQISQQYKIEQQEQIINNSKLF